MLDIGYKEYTLYRNGGYLYEYFPIWAGDQCPRQASLAPDTVDPGLPYGTKEARPSWSTLYVCHRVFPMTKTCN